jgi:hypothetical protein
VNLDAELLAAFAGPNHGSGDLQTWGKKNSPNLRVGHGPPNPPCSSATALIDAGGDLLQAAQRHSTPSSKLHPNHNDQNIHGTSQAATGGIKLHPKRRWPSVCARQWLFVCQVQMKCPCFLFLDSNIIKPVPLPPNWSLIVFVT